MKKITLTLLAALSMAFEIAPKVAAGGIKPGVAVCAGVMASKVAESQNVVAYTDTQGKKWHLLVTNTVGVSTPSNAVSVFASSKDTMYLFLENIKVPGMNTGTRPINSSTFQISATRQAYVDYNVNIDNTSTLASNQTMSVIPEYSTNNGSTWITQDISKSSLSQLLDLTVTLVSGGTVKVTGTIPAAAIVRIRTTGTGTATYVFGKETY